MNILIKLMSVVSLVLAPWLARVHSTPTAVSRERVLDALRTVIGLG